MRKILFVIILLSTISFTTHAKAYCFNEIAAAAESAVLSQFPQSDKVSLFKASGPAWTNGNYVKKYNKLDFNTYLASGVANEGSTERVVTITVDTKAGTCEILGTKVEVGDVLNLE